MKKSAGIIAILLVDIFFGFILITGFMAVYNGTAQSLENHGYLPVEATYVYSDYVMNKNNELEKAYFLKYNINGTSYTSYVIGNSNNIDTIENKYIVYYNPTNPSKIICPKSTGTTISSFIFLCIVCLVLIVINIKIFAKSTKHKKYNY